MLGTGSILAKAALGARKGLNYGGFSTRGGGGAPVDTTIYMTDKDGVFVLDKQGNNIEIKG